ncbi:unnamed protein product [Meloidogyne enterolobii]|uniref:Uncharacterized protein n=1 Tax=Meloidogyne enterolobii TaxID=390850 RepID=A0ACB0YDQ3_MELEN
MNNSNPYLFPSTDSNPQIFNGITKKSNYLLKRMSFNNLSQQQLIPSPFPISKFASCSQVPSISNSSNGTMNVAKKYSFKNNQRRQQNFPSFPENISKKRLSLTKSSKFLQKTIKEAIDIKNKAFIQSYKDLIRREKKKEGNEEEIKSVDDGEEEVTDEEEYEYISDYEDDEEEEYEECEEEDLDEEENEWHEGEKGDINQKMKEWRSSEGNVPLEKFLPCRGLVVNGIESKDDKSLVENGCFRIDTLKSSSVFELKLEREKEEICKDFVGKEECELRIEEENYENYDYSLRKDGEKEDNEQKENEIEDEDWDEEVDDEAEDEAYLSPWSSRRSDRSTPLSQCSTSTATFIMNLPVPTGAELPPSASSYHHNSREEWRHSSPVDKLVVDEVHFTFRLFTSTPSTSSPRNSKENTENADTKQSPRWRADSLNEALPAFRKDQQPQKQQILPSVDQKQRLSTSLENTPLSSPVNESLQHIGKTEQNSTLPIIEPPTPTTNTSSSLPLIQTEKRKINIEDNNKYLNGFALNNDNEVISSTFLPQTVIQTSALQAQQQIKNNSTTTPTSSLQNNQKNNIISQNCIIPNNSELQQQKTNNNYEFEKQFSSSLSPPPCYQQAANSLRLSPIAGRLAGIPRFHFPMGRPIGKVESDAKLNRIKELFQSFPDGKISFADFDELCRRMDMAIYTKAKFYFLFSFKQKSYKISKDNHEKYC